MPVTNDSLLDLLWRPPPRHTCPQPHYRGSSEGVLHRAFGSPAVPGSNRKATLLPRLVDGSSFRGRVCWNTLLPRSLDFCRVSKLMKVSMMKMNDEDVWEVKNHRGGPRESQYLTAKSKAEAGRKSDDIARGGEDRGRCQQEQDDLGSGRLADWQFHEDDDCLCVYVHVPQGKVNI